jgi:hypothetical protein
MKKLAFFLMGLLMLAACSEQTPFAYRGLPFTLSTTQLLDSMRARGFDIDSAASSQTTMVLANPAVRYRVLVAYSGDKLLAIQENYLLSTNDSTRRMWQQVRDGLEKELGEWPNCPILKDDHKVANFDATDGIISVTLENTYRPTMMVKYTPKSQR